MDHVDESLRPSESVADREHLQRDRCFGAGSLNTDAGYILDAITALGGNATSFQIALRSGGADVTRINAAVDHLERFRLVKVARGAGMRGLNFTVVLLASRA